MRKLCNHIIYFLLASVVIAQECPPTDTLSINPMQNNWNIPVVNNWNGLEVMTWNIREFPATSNTISYVQEIITDMLPDVIAIQEVSQLSSLNNLANNLPAYEFVHTDYEADGGYSGYDLAIAVRSDCVTITNTQTLFPYDGWEFAYRNPLMVNIQWGCGTSSLSTQIINVHFKCCNDGFERRLLASEILANYIENQSPNHVIVAGDFNDEITNSQSNNSLWPLVDSNEMYFTTTPIANNNYYNSHPWGTNSFIDHILISSSLMEYVDDSDIQTIRLDNYIGSSSYQTNISDHRPVNWSIVLQQIEAPTGLIINEIMQNPQAVSDSYGEWFELTNIGSDIIDLNGLTIYDTGEDYHQIQNGGSLNLAPNEFIVLGIEDNTALNGNISVDYKYSNFFLSNSWDEVCIGIPSGEMIDCVAYDNGSTFPDPTGASIQLIDIATENDNGENWSTSIQLMSNGDYGTPGSTNFVENECTPNGDVNQDLVLNVIDIVMVVNYILDEVNFTDTQYCIADGNSDMIINVIDIVLIVNEILR
jgi:endonuclease/exonuclease/phosphatase family metal-dependent hydrolase